MAYTWAESSGRYRDARGRYASDRSVRAVIDSLAGGASDRMAAASTALLEGRTSLGAWQAEMMREIRLSQSAAAVIAHGGADQMTPARWLQVARDVKAEYRYLRAFAQDVESGRQPFNGSLTARSRQYGQAARAAFERERGRGQQERGFRWEKNVLAPAEHCAQCREQTARGWVPIGSLVPVGRRTCRSNCRCRLEFAREIQVAA